MGTLSLTDPVNGTTADASLIATNNAAIKTVVNGGIDNTNIAAAAAISASKLASYPNDSTKYLAGDGTWAAPPTAGTQLDYAKITANTSNITVTTEATATAVITGNSVSYDGTQVKVEFFAPGYDTGSNSILVTGVLLCDTDVLGTFPINTDGTNEPISVSTFHTPAAGDHTYVVKFYVSAQHVVIHAGAGGSGNALPAYLRVTKA